jgi:predicted lipoprotein with Yx(FWY)xxD motif
MVILLVLVITALLIAGCTQQQQAQPTPEPTQLPTQAPASATQPVVLAAPTIGTASSTLGTILVDPQGKTLYYFTNDVPGSGASACNGQCAIVWPPVSVSTASVSGLNPADFASIMRSDGSQQTTYRGRPLYTYSGDAQPGNANGQGFNGVWYVANAAGTVPAPTTQPTTFNTLSPYGGGYASGGSGGGSGGGY